MNGIKVLPPVISTEEDLNYFLGSFEDTIARFYGRQGPIVSLGRGLLETAAKKVGRGRPGRRTGDRPDDRRGSGKKNPTRSELSHRSLRGPGSCSGSTPTSGPIRDDTDFVIVGSGPAGATLAYRLAASGKKVVVLEAGAKLGTGDFTRDIGKTLASHFWDGGTRSVRGNVFFPTLQVRALGGGSVFNSAICMRPLDSALQRWREDSGLEEFTPDALAPYFDAVERFYNIRPTDESVMGRRNLLFREACDSLGWSSAAAHRFEDGCRGSGNCLVGCPNEAKNSMDRRGDSSRRSSTGPWSTPRSTSTS